MINVNDILKEKGYDFYSVEPDTFTLDVLKVMADKNIGAVLVTEKEKLTGIFSERDYARKIILKGKSSGNTRVSECMSSKVITVSKDSLITDCMQLMTQNHIRHLPVLEGEKIVGLVSIGDIVSRIIREQSNTIQQLENYIIRG